MPSYVARVTLCREAKPADDSTSLREQWRVRWTIEQNGRLDNQTIAHATEAAARRHAGNLVKRRAPSTSIEDVYAEEQVDSLSVQARTFANKGWKQREG